MALNRNPAWRIGDNTFDRRSLLRRALETDGRPGRATIAGAGSSKATTMEGRIAVCGSAVEVVAGLASMGDLDADTSVEPVAEGQWAARRLVAQPPLAMTGARRAIQTGWFADAEAGLRTAVKAQLRCLLSEDFHEARRALLDGRAPTWRGR